MKEFTDQVGRRFSVMYAKVTFFGGKNKKNPGVHQLRMHHTWKLAAKGATFVDWSKTRTTVIDFITFRNLHPLQFCILPDEFKSGRMLSDHRPIFASFYLSNLPASADVSAA